MMLNLPFDGFLFPFYYFHEASEIVLTAFVYLSVYITF